MSDFDRNYARTVPVDRADMSVDAGLRSFMLGVYNKLGLGLVLSGVMAGVTAYVPAVRDLMFAPNGRSTIVGLIVGLSPLAILLFGMGAARTAKGASTIYWLLVALIGASMGYVFLRYNIGSVTTAFLATAVAFGSLSLFGYTTKKDISGWGSFLMMGLVGVIGVMLVSMVASLFGAGFMNGPLALILNIVIVLLFAGFTAFDTQRLKMMYYQIAGDAEALGVATSMGALSLFLNIINMFQALLAIFGNRN